MDAKKLIAVVAMLAASASVFAEAQPRFNLRGDSAPVSDATRTIVITADTKYVNVTGGETVKFVVGEKSFAWIFDGPQSVLSFDLDRTVPPSVLDHKVVAYVAPNPLYVMP
jgi:hypothetical protein